MILETSQKKEQSMTYTTRHSSEPVTSGRKKGRRL